MIAAAQAVKDAGGGLFQMIPELGMTGLTPAQEFGLMRGVSDAVGLPITFLDMERFVVLLSLIQQQVIMEHIMLLRREWYAVI